MITITAPNIENIQSGNVGNLGDILKHAALVELGSLLRSRNPDGRSNYLDTHTFLLEDIQVGRTETSAFELTTKLQPKICVLQQICGHRDDSGPERHLLVLIPTGNSHPAQRRALSGRVRPFYSAESWKAACRTGRYPAGAADEYEGLEPLQFVWSEESDSCSC